MAVGFYKNTSPSTSTHRAMIEAWNVTAWSFPETTPLPENELVGAEIERMFGVSCSTTTLCTAVGEHIGELGVEVPLAERLAIAPVAETEAATSIGATGATLNGTVNPNAAETTYRFEYGKTTSYGTSVPVPEGNLGAGISSPSGAKYSPLTSVSCTSSITCTAIGTFENTAGKILPLAGAYGR